MKIGVLRNTTGKLPTGDCLEDSILPQTCEIPTVHFLRPFGNSLSLLSVHGNTAPSKY